MAICPNCKGTGHIDLDVHCVLANAPTTVCGKPRPINDKRRTTNDDRITCAPCRQIRGLAPLEVDGSTQQKKEVSNGNQPK